MINKAKFIKITAILTAILLCVVFFVLFIYLVIIPKMIESDLVQNYAKKAVQSSLGLDLSVKNIRFKTYLKPRVDFDVDGLTLKKDDNILVELENFNSSVNFNKILKKEIKLNTLKAKKLDIKLDELLSALDIKQTEKTEQKPFDYKININNSDIKLDDMELSYMLNGTLLKLFLKDAFVEQEQRYKNLGFNLEVNIIKNGSNYIDIIAPASYEIKIYDDKIKVDNLNVVINNSALKLSGLFDKDNISLNSASDKFYLEDVFKLIKSNLFISNGEEMLKILADEGGSVAFNVDMINNELSGYININNTKAKIKDLSNIPLNIQKGKILISKSKIDFQNLEGYWGKNKKNKIKIQGDIKDYYKTFDSYLTIDTSISNEFFKDYLAKLIGTTIYISKPSSTRIIYKAKNNIMDIVWLAKISKGVNFGADESKSALSDYDRAVKGDFHIDGNKLDIKNINYYIAPDIKRGIKIEPILVLDGLINLSGKIDNIGFSFNREIPAEFLNVFLGQSLFKKGTIIGNLHVAFKNDIPYLKADMVLKKTFIPSQRLFIKSANLKTKNDYINIDMEGGFKRIKYKFNGDMKNVLLPPYRIRNLDLDVDNIDVERFLASVNNKETMSAEVDTKAIEEGSVDDNFMFNTNLVRIEDADFTLHKGKYKELTFGNIKAKMTLDEKGILKVRSNRFDIAEGISTLKIECDLTKLKYYLRLGLKDVDSNLMAKVLLNLDKEISGKAAGLIELYGDESLKLNGKINFLVHDGTIGKIGLVEYVLKIALLFRNPIVMISPGTIMDIVSVPEGKFDKIEGELNIKDNVVRNINIKSYSSTLSALIRGRFDMEKHDASLRIYTRFSTDKNSMFGFLRNISLNALANKVKMNTRNDANYYASELEQLPQIDVDESQAQVFLTQVEGDVEHFNFLSSLKKIK